MSREGWLTVVWGAAIAFGIGAVTAYFQDAAVLMGIFIALTAASVIPLVLLHRAKRPAPEPTRPHTSPDIRRAEHDHANARHARISAETEVETARIALENDQGSLRSYRERDLAVAKGRLAHAVSDEERALRAVNELRAAAGLEPLTS